MVQVSGTVQGVGFRPYVFRLASSMGLTGWVKNTTAGVVIEVEGEEFLAAGFIERLKSGAPPASRITGITRTQLPPAGYGDFRIVDSADDGRFCPVSPDLNVCPECLREMADPSDRRYLYPFINCTNCGPRYSILREIPYDRKNTSMSVFPICPECERQYRDPMDRRFHAEPVACPQCGPGLSFYSDGGAAAGEDPLKSALRVLREGGIVAIKGLGGFHLVCDALNRKAVILLRNRKRKNQKPFALMAGGIDSIRKFCIVSAAEEKLLLGPERPIVLLQKKLLQKKGPAQGGQPEAIMVSETIIPEEVAPGSSRLGFMLPYTPLHWLLFHYPQGPDFENPRFARLESPQFECPKFEYLVMTSGNISEEPIVTENAEAKRALSAYADAFIFHDRDIHTRVDDSVIRADRDGSGKKVFVRRARGYVPRVIRLPGEADGPEMLGAGADLKNTFTLTKGDCAITSQHIGDMENPKTLSFYEETLEKLKSLYRVNPECIAYDLHPGYFSTMWALRQEGIIKIPIQHHYAHIASVMAENFHFFTSGRKCIGVAFDGTGLGTDGTLWGGEFLIAGVDGFERAGHIRPFPLPGGEQAVRQPWRVAISLLREAFGGDAAKTAGLIAGKTGFLKTGLSQDGQIDNLIDKVIDICGMPDFSPPSSGAGRLFDAVSALLGLADINTFEAEAAMRLEAVAAGAVEEPYPFDVVFERPAVVDFRVTFSEIAGDIAKGRPAGLISARFHNSVAGAIAKVALWLSEETGIRDIALGGGVFQNAYLFEKTIGLLAARPEVRVHVNRVVPANDGGISLGQAYIARERFR